MQLREFADGDVAQAMHGPADQGDQWQRTLVAEEDDAAIGMGTLLLSSVHRASYYCEITVEPGSRHRGVGRTIFEELLAIAPEPYPVMSRAMASQPSRAAFAEAVGFHVLMRCPAPQLNPMSAAATHWVNSHLPPPWVCIVPARERSFEEILDAWTDLYVWIHETWSPTHPRETVRGLFAASGLAEVDFDLSRVAVVDGQIVALALVLPDRWASRSFVVTETVQRCCPAGTQVLAATIAAALRSCAEHRIGYAEFDGHEVDPHFYPLAQTLPVIGSDPMQVMKHPGAGCHRGRSRRSRSIRRA